MNAPNSKSPLTMFAKKPKPPEPSAQKNAPTPKAQNEPTEDLLSFKPQQVLFHKGEPGGDLFLIQSGIIEIFNEKDGVTTVLSEMKPGEIIGIMTCLNNEPRMASARAKTTAVCKRIPHAQMIKTVSEMPPWLSVVLKEFGIRLRQSNEQFMEATTKAKKLELNSITPIYTATQLASTLCYNLDAFCKPLDDLKVLFLEETAERTAQILNRSREEIDALLLLLQDSGLIRVEVEPERKRKYIRAENAAALGSFVQFVRESKSGSTKKLLKAKFSNKEFRAAMALTLFAKKAGKEITKTTTLAASILKAQQEKITGTAFEASTIQQLADVELLKMEAKSGDLMIHFNPQVLARTMTCLETLRKLAVFDPAQYLKETQNKS